MWCLLGANAQHTNFKGDWACKHVLLFSHWTLVHRVWVWAWKQFQYCSFAYWLSGCEIEPVLLIQLLFVHSVLIHWIKPSLVPRLSPLPERRRCKLRGDPSGLGPWVPRSPGPRSCVLGSTEYSIPYFEIH